MSKEEIKQRIEEAIQYIERIEEAIQYIENDLQSFLHSKEND